MSLEFIVWTRIEALDGAYRVVASAVPRGASLRCCPEERSAICSAQDETDRVARRLAERLISDLARRGHATFVLDAGMKQ
jgi:hypothetical protein